MTMWWTILPAASALCALGLAAFVISRNPRGLAHQSLALGMLALSVIEVGHFMAALQPDDELWWTRVSFAGKTLLPLPWLAFSLTFGRPHPGEHLRRRRVELAVVAAASLAFLGLLAVGRFVTDDLLLRRAGLWFSMFLLLALTAVLANIEHTARSADRAQRRQMKYMLSGVFTIMAVGIFQLTHVILYASAEAWLPPLLSTARLIGCGLIVVALARYRPFEVSVSLSRYVVYNSVAVVLVGAYLLGVGFIAAAVQRFGDTAAAFWGSVVVVVSLIALATTLISFELRRRLRDFINRHVFRSKYHYRKEWLDLTERLSSKPTIEAIVPALGAMLFETFWILDTRLWLADEHERGMHPATPAADARSIRWPPSALTALKERDEPLPLNAPGTARATDIAGLPVGPLRDIGVRVLVPLVVQDRLVGVLGLSEPQSVLPLTGEDFDLLRTIGKQVAASVLNAQLLRQVVASKELESFHAFSTFLLHDLKNFVSMLSLLVENMERNFDNPAFRHDALKNLSQTVDKMKRLMERLRALAQPPAPAFEAVDLNELGRAVVNEVQPSLKATVVTNWGEAPPVRADAAQIRRVLINLLLNAEEAVGGPGRISVSTRADNGIVTCSVADNGPGISPEFLETRLFKPFATTKSGGFGVGLYQCKTIVEAHGGRVTAESQIGQGSILSFSIPAMKDGA